MNEDLQEPEGLTEEDLFTINDRKPNIGCVDCPKLTERYGTRLVLVIKKKGDGVYGCYLERCSAYSTHDLEEAIRHFRLYHFKTSPCPAFRSTVINGMSHTVSYPILFPVSGERLTWLPRIATLPDELPK